MAEFMSKEEQEELNRMSGGGSPQAADDGSGFAVDDSFSFTTDGLDSDQVETAGWLDKEGNYHFDITDVKFDKSAQKGTPFLELTLKVLHTIPGQSPDGAKFTSRHYLTDGTRPFITLLGHRIGALKAVPVPGKVNDKGDPVYVYVDAKTGKSNITPETWFAAKGHQFIGLVKYVPAEGTFKEKYELVTNKCWPVDAEQVADVPKNLQAMKLIGKANFVAAAGQVKPPAKPPASTPPAKPPKTPPVAAPADDLSDL